MCHFLSLDIAGVYISTLLYTNGLEKRSEEHCDYRKERSKTKRVGQGAERLCFETIVVKKERRMHATKEKSVFSLVEDSRLRRRRRAFFFLDELQWWATRRTSLTCPSSRHSSESGSAFTTHTFAFLYQVDYPRTARSLPRLFTPSRKAAESCPPQSPE